MSKWGDYTAASDSENSVSSLWLEPYARSSLMLVHDRDEDGVRRWVLTSRILPHSIPLLMANLPDAKVEALTLVKTRLLAVLMMVDEALKEAQ